VHDVILTDPTQVAPVTYGTTPYQLAFALSPSGATLSTNFTTQPVVVVEDQAGNVVPGALVYFTIKISPASDTGGVNSLRRVSLLSVVRAPFTTTIAASMRWVPTNWKLTPRHYRIPRRRAQPLTCRPFR